MLVTRGEHSAASADATRHVFARLTRVDDERRPASDRNEHADPTQNATAEVATERRPSRWLALAFVGLLSTLVLLGTTGVGAAAANLLAGPEFVCGGP
jgi:hypothetical protein